MLPRHGLLPISQSSSREAWQSYLNDDFWFTGIDFVLTRCGLPVWITIAHKSQFESTGVADARHEHPALQLTMGPCKCYAMSNARLQPPNYPTTPQHCHSQSNSNPLAPPRAQYA